MKTIHNTYSNIPCQGRDCIFWDGEYEEIRHYPKGYNKDSGLYSEEEFTSIWHGEHCKKNFQLGQLRQSIYERASEASDKIYNESKYKRIITMIAKAHSAFNEIADEWRNMRCPFYAVETEDDNCPDGGLDDMVENYLL